MSNLKRGQNLGACMSVTIVSKSSELFGVASSTEPKIMIAFKIEGKASSEKQISGRKQKQFNRDRRTLTWIVKKDHENTVPKITADFNDYLEKSVFSKTVRRGLHEAGFQGKAVISKQ